MVLRAPVSTTGLGANISKYSVELLLVQTAVADLTCPKGVDVVGNNYLQANTSLQNLDEIAQ